ncbi:hypothetical protein BZG82_04060 [Salinivibrio sp. PR5]|uniref:hypothetical protein n=1 Tax=Salinivibrio sp. PR5 TaxID=1909484 RepID=UPI000989B5A5|nr:hypothetical protein [Salinivibrio sp. PR5]OOF11430.1 hypothetical protein BZG82_04060 [Salinivibrio sp. PR5]
MKKSTLIYLSLSLFTVFFASFIALMLYRNALLAVNLEHGRYSACFDDEAATEHMMPTWSDKEAFTVRFVPVGGHDCLAPNFPAIEVSSHKVTHWLHIVTTSGEQQFSGKHASFGNGQSGWTFVDVGSQERRNNSYPFYSEGEVFRDNPSWTAPPHRTLRWEGMLFGLSEVDGVFYPVGGISWGFNLFRWSLIPQPILPKSLARRHWLAVFGALNEEYPYKFSADTATNKTFKE